MSYPRSPKNAAERNAIRNAKQGRNTCNRTRDGWSCDRKQGHLGDHIAVCTEPDQVWLRWPIEKNEMRGYYRARARFVDLIPGSLPNGRLNPGTILGFSMVPKKSKWKVEAVEDEETIITALHYLRGGPNPRVNDYLVLPNVGVLKITKIDEF